MKGALKKVNRANKIKPLRSKIAGSVLCLLSVFLLLCLIVSPAAAKFEWKVTPSNPAVGDTLKIKGTASPDESLGAEVSFEKEVPVYEGRYEYLLEDIKIPDGLDNRFEVTADGVEDLNVKVSKFGLIKLTLHSDASGGSATISQANVPPLTYDEILIDGDAESGMSSVNLRFTASQVLTADSKGKFEYRYDTSSMPAGEFNIKIGGSEKTVELRAKEEKPKEDKSKEQKSKGQKKSAVAFSACYVAGKEPLKIQFTDKSERNPTSWKWDFGDGTYSTRQNPVHTYSKAGKYTVTLTTGNSEEKDTETKSKCIIISKKK